jgi:hypothetical protein
MKTLCTVLGTTFVLSAFALGCREGERPQTPHAVKEDTKTVVHKATDGANRASDKVDQETGHNHDQGNLSRAAGKMK